MKHNKLGEYTLDKPCYKGITGADQNAAPEVIVLDRLVVAKDKSFLKSSTTGHTLEIKDWTLFIPRP
jgi:hypothetical protein